MFGYVRICREELDNESFERFRAYYCGLCKKIGKYSNIARLGLSYDMTFLLLLLSSVCDEEDEIAECRCMLHPLKKEHMVKDNQILDYVANMSILLVYRKFEDDWKDERSLKALAGKMLYYRAVRIVKNQFAQQDEKISFYLSEISRLEAENCSDSDEIADCFAKLCESLFSPDFISGRNTKRVLEWIGYNIGRWIYLIDAFDDLEKDKKNNAYNPLKSRAEKSSKDELASELETTLTYTLANIAAAYDILDIKRNDTILKNILYAGLCGMQTKVLNIQEEKDGSV